MRFWWTFFLFFFCRWVQTNFFHRSRSRVPLKRIAMFYMYINSEQFNECSTSMSYDSSQQINESIDSVSKSKDLIRPCCALLPQRVEIWMKKKQMLYKLRKGKHDTYVRQYFFLVFENIILLQILLKENTALLSTCRMYVCDRRDISTLLNNLMI